jgi:hypothetical protein
MPLARLDVHGLAQAALPAHRQQQSRQRMMPEPDLTPSLAPKNWAPKNWAPKNWALK